MQVTAFFIDQQLRRWCFVIRLPMCYEALLQVAGVTDGCNVHAFLH